MTVAITTITALKALAPGSKALNWLEEMRAWYWYDPTSTATGDNDTVITPNNNIGRWIKQYANPVNNNLTWQTRNTTGDFTAAANTGYLMDFTSFSGDVTATLPSSPTVGTVVRFQYMSVTNISKRLIINPNGASINNQSSNVFIYKRNTRVTLTWQGSTFGWYYDSNDNYGMQTAGVVTSFSKPSLTTSNQRGIIDYIGKRFNSGNSFVNPGNSTILSNGVTYFAGGDVTGISTSASNGLTQQTFSSTFLLNPNGTGGLDPFGSFLVLPINTSDYTKQYPIRLQDLYVEWLASTSVPTNAAGVSHIAIYGTNDIIETATYVPLKPSWLNTNRNTANTARQINSTFIMANWELITAIDVNSLTFTNGNIRGGAGGASAAFLPINSGKYYTTYRMAWIFGQATYSGTNSSQLAGIEMYGDIIVS